MIIYLVTAPSGHQYVGQTIRTLTKRWAEHCYYARESDHEYALYNAIRKYGPEQFKVEILKEVQTKAELDFYEQFYIQTLNTLAPNGYNLTLGGEGSLLSEETKEKIAKAHRGQHYSDERRKQMSETAKQFGLKPPYRTGFVGPNKGKRMSEEQKQKIRKTMQERGIKPLRPCDWSGQHREGLRGKKV